MFQREADFNRILRMRVLLHILRESRFQPNFEDSRQGQGDQTGLAFLQRQEEPVSRRAITQYGHCCVAIVEPILDQLVESGQVSRIKIPGSRVQWFYQLSDSTKCLPSQKV